MRNIVLLLIFGTIYGISTSCEEMFGDFLDKGPGVDVTEDTIFSSVTEAETFLASCYQNGMHSGYAYCSWKDGSNNVGNAYTMGSAWSWAAVADECDNPLSWVSSNMWNNGMVNPLHTTNGYSDARYYPRWTAIRYINTMIENIESVPGIDPAYAAQIIGEMKFLTALNYFELFKFYGGVPIITRSYLPDEIVKVRRSSIDSTVTYIIKNCDEALSLLPEDWSSNWKGRATRGAALALKARTLLYAASPLFNTATPYLNMPDPNDNRLICFGNYDVDRWKQAADAAKAVLDWASTAGFRLVTDKGVDKNYKYVWEVMDNPEIIFSDKRRNGGGSPFSYYWPKGFGGSNGSLVTQQFVEKFYENRFTGKPIVWYSTGNDLNQKYDSMDYRFKQSVGYNGSFWNTQRGNLQLWQPNGLHINLCYSGYWAHKFIPEAVNAGNATTPVNWPLFRLAEFYLSYAEALNEYNASPPQAAYDMVNAIRARSGMPNIPTGLSQAQFRDRIIKEWGVEYFLEDRRFWDLKRWLLAESIIPGPVYGIKIYKVGTGTPQQYRYEKYVFENRTFPKKYYLHVFNPNEVNMGYTKQNPGW